MSTVANRPRRTQAERRDESGRRLLEAAAAIVADQGLAAATFEAIGAEAGYSRGLATQRFGSKQGLTEALIGRLVLRLDDLLAGRGVDGLPGLEALLAFAEIFLSLIDEDREVRAYFVLLAGAVADRSDLSAPFTRTHAGVEARLAAMLRRGQADGSVRAGLDPEAAALMAGALLMGLALQRLIDPAMALDPVRVASLAALRQSFAAEIAASPARP